MTSVIDASTLLATAADSEVETGADAARAVVPELAHLHGLAAPYLLLWEVANVVHYKHPHQFGASWEQRSELVQTLLSIVELDLPDQAARMSMGQIAEQHRLTAYDASYLEVTLRHPDNILVTQDKQLHRVATRLLGRERVMDSEEAHNRSEAGTL